MLLLLYELKKTLLSPLLLGFLVLCIALNVVITFSYNVPDYDWSDAEPRNVFVNYDASELADYYVRLHNMSGSAEANIRTKYVRLQLVINEKAENGDALSTYLGGSTYYMHSLLFGTLLFAVIAESCLIALFAALLSTGYENTYNTEQIICASKTGRRILHTKLMATVVTGFAAFTVILGVALVVFFIRFDFSAVWHDNVSSSFNFAPGEWPEPFMTWHSFTVAGLLLAVIVAAMGLTAVFSLFGFVLGTFFHSSYVSCGIAVALCILQYVVSFIPQVGGTLCGVINLTPIMLWANSGKWFTDGGATIAWANFESVGVIAQLIILSAAGLLAATLYRRRELL
ncbi:MAG: hypothetical protein FWH40_07325 [Coriobacteriia bacterium]|nr:hypothetical protein [Coriobacteriia bacterium]